MHPTRLSTYEVWSVFTSASPGQTPEVSGKTGVASLPQTSTHLSFLTCPFSLVFLTARSLPQLSWGSLAYKEYSRSSSKAHFSPHLGHTHLCTCTSRSFQVTSLGNLLWVCQLFFEIQERSINREILFWSSRELTHSKQRPRNKSFIRPTPHHYYYHFFLKASHGSCISLRIWKLIKFRICRVSAFHIARALN